MKKTVLFLLAVIGTTRSLVPVAAGTTWNTQLIGAPAQDIKATLSAAVKAHKMKVNNVMKPQTPLKLPRR